jgi:hypothetical protein
MPKRTTINCTTGELEEDVELVGDELAAHQALVASPPPPLPRPLDELVEQAVARALAARAAR